MKDLVILKLGGSVITFKDREVPEANVDAIRRLVSEIKRAKEERDFNLIIVHGSGAFGHQLVVRHGIKNGISTEAHAEGFVRTHNSVESLNKTFVGELNAAGLISMQIQPNACIMQTNRVISHFDTSSIESLLEMDSRIIPVMYGTMAIDTKLGGSVLNSDSIMSHLAKKLGAKNVYFGTDVAGIFTEDPRVNPDAEFVRDVNRDNIQEVFAGVSESHNVDVTGGMRGKLENIIADFADSEVNIFDASVEDNVYRMLIGEDVGGTRIGLS